jgi:hypothetical protein
MALDEMQLADRAMASGDFATAQGLLERVVLAEPNRLPAWLALAAARRQRERFEEAFDALRGALRVDPRNFPALLMHASLLERIGRNLEAAEAFGIALVQSPAEEHLDAATLRAVQHAQDVYKCHQRQIQEYVRDKSAAARRRCGSAGQHRLEAFIDSTLRLQKRFRQEPSDYFYPGLPAIEFYGRDEFPWLPALERATADVLLDLREVLRSDLPGFQPYVQYPDHAPLEQWRELNRSPMWTSYNLYESGIQVAERCAHAPNTIEALKLVGQPEVFRRSPCAMFSRLRPHTRIPPHTGVANFRLVVHLPLILPGQCRFRVGSQVRQWQMGEAWVFDDTLEHEAWNDSDEDRIILIFDIWNPRIPEDERTGIAQIIAATDAYRGVRPQAQI